MALVRLDNQISNSVYAWGRGWYGQLGTGKLENQYVPVKIEFSGSKSLSFAMITCGERHTLLLDRDGNIWFAGQLIASGLEAPDNDKRSEFAMLSSLSKKVPNEAMLYIASGQNHNLSLSGTNKVYAFGRNDYCKCGARLEEESVFFEEVTMSDISISLVSCGRRHSVACDIKGMPYSWGNLTYGRLGINPTTFEQREKEVLCIDAPKEIMTFKALFAGRFRFICRECGQGPGRTNRKRTENLRSRPIHDTAKAFDRVVEHEGGHFVAEIHIDFGKAERHSAKLCGERQVHQVADAQTAHAAFQRSHIPNLQ